MSKIIMTFIMMMVVLRNLGAVQFEEWNINRKDEIYVYTAEDSLTSSFEDIHGESNKEKNELPEISAGEEFELPIEINPELQSSSNLKENNMEQDNMAENKSDAEAVIKAAEDNVPGSLKGTETESMELPFIPVE